jgi:hypothetical protein
VCVISIALGVLGAAIGIPANYGMTTAQALAVLDYRPVFFTTVWAVWAVAVTFAALWRARWLARNEPGVRLTAVRGSIWLWGAIGAPWAYPWMAWDVQLFDFFNENPPLGSSSPAGTIVMWWWLGAGLALVVAVVWSAARPIANAAIPIERAVDDVPRTADPPGSNR